MENTFFEKNAEEDFASRKHLQNPKKHDETQYINSLEGNFDYQFDQIFRRTHKNNHDKS